MSAPIRVLILSDRAADINLMLHELRQAGFEPDWERVETEPEYLQALELPPELILADWSLQSFKGLRALQLLQARNQDVPFIIVISNSVEEDAAIEAVRRGASDYLMNDRMVRLGQVVQRALENKRLRQERKQAEKTLRESERQYQNLFENAVLGIFRVTVEGKPIDVNPRFASMLGYASSNEFLSTISNAAEIFADPRRRAEILRIKAKNPALTTFESQYRRKDGSTFVGNLTLREIAGSEGEVAYLEGFLEDITERKRAEETLRKSEARFRTIFENSTAGVTLVSLDSRYLMVNPAFCDICGYSAKELMQRNFFQITHPEDIAISQEVMQKVIDSKGKSIQFTKRYIHKDRHTIWAELSSALVYSSDGQPEYFLTHISDATERKRIEEALRQSEAELRALVEQIPAIVYTESVEKPGKTLYISPQIETTSGYTPAEWMRSTKDRKSVV
jgi:PAS domain S-box-containing protein